MLTLVWCARQNADYREHTERRLVREANDARNAIAFQQRFQNEFGFFKRQIHPVKRIASGIREHLPALATLISSAIPALAKGTAFSTAVVTGNMDLDLSSGPVQNGSGPRKRFLSASAARLRSAGNFNYRLNLFTASGPGWVRTSGLPGSNETLYPTELRGHKTKSFLLR